MGYRESLSLAFEHSLAHIENLPNSPVGPTVDLETLRTRFNRPLTDAGVEPERVIADLVEDVSGGIMGSSSGRFFAWVRGGTLPAALAADWLVSAWDQNAALYLSAPAATVIEEVAGAWLKQVLGLPEDASFAFVTGTQAAHTVCLAAARHALMARSGWDVERRGLFGAPAIRILTSSEHHGTVDRAVRLLGMGLDCIEILPADDRGRLQPEVLERAFERRPAAPAIVVLQAGDLNIGAYDPFANLIPLAHRQRAWVHVDGAFGLWVAASPRLRHLVAGVDAADSWATDGHKWLNTPFDSGFAFVADPQPHRAAMSQEAAYISRRGDAREPTDWNLEWSRRARGFAAYAALRQLGRRGIAELVDRCSDAAGRLVRGIGALPGVEVLWESAINQGLVRFLDPRPGASDADHDRRTDAVIAAIQAGGEAFFGGSSWRGRRVMRVSVCSWQTTAADVERSIEAVRAALDHC